MRTVYHAETSAARIFDSIEHMQCMSSLAPSWWLNLAASGATIWTRRRSHRPNLQFQMCDPAIRHWHGHNALMPNQRGQSASCFRQRFLQSHARPLAVILINKDHTSGFKRSLDSSHSPR